MIRSGFIFFLLFIILINCSQKEQDYTSYVNPFIGTAEFGHCFPGACVPFGLIQAGPETGKGEWKYCAGYQYEDSVIVGFSQTRLNGTGCPDLGDVLIYPFAGSPQDNNYESRFLKDQEKAKPEFYSVYLSDAHCDVEVTATPHVAFYQFTFEKNRDSHVLLDLQSAMVFNENQLYNHVLDAALNFESSTQVSGYVKTKVWVERTYSFYIEFSKPMVGKRKLEKRYTTELAPRFVLDFDDQSELQMKISISSTGIEGAKKNLSVETPDWNFEATRKKAKSQWNNYLSRVEIEGTEDQKAMFYTSMYHLLIQPNNIADTEEEPFYSTLSLWDTYRAAHPLYTIITPEHVDGFISSILKQYDRQSFLPIWTLWGVENYCMIGNHSVPVIVDAYLKGFNGFDAEKAYDAIKKSLTENHLNSDWNIYDQYGYYPFDLVKSESVSKTLESVYDDHCAALFAKALNKEEDYSFFLNRSGFYKNLFDFDTKFMRGRNCHGEWRTPFNSLGLSHSGMIGGDYTEGNAWQYTWHVQHDVHGLIDLMGGDEYFTTKIDSLFEVDSSGKESGFVADVTGLIGQYAHGNEPSHHISYLYALAGKPWKTQKLVNEICKTQYLNKVNGLCGNDDCGQMSAWYIFSCLGFYPVDPCGGEYVIGAPQFKKAIVKVGNGKSLIIDTDSYSKDNIYVKSIEWNGKPFKNNVISHLDIVKGGQLKFHMTDTPSQ